jgi:hypothetical protein
LSATRLSPVLSPCHSTASYSHVLDQYHSWCRSRHSIASTAGWSAKIQVLGAHLESASGDSNLSLTAKQISSTKLLFSAPSSRLVGDKIWSAPTINSSSRSRRLLIQRPMTRSTSCSDSFATIFDRPVCQSFRHHFLRGPDRGIE